MAEPSALAHDTNPWSISATESATQPNYTYAVTNMVDFNNFHPGQHVFAHPTAFGPTIVTNESLPDTSTNYERSLSHHDRDDEMVFI